MDKRETSLSLSVHVTYPFMLVMKSAIEGAIERQQELTVCWDGESAGPGQYPGMNIVIGVHPYAGPDGRAGPESYEVEACSLDVRGDEAKPRGLTLMALSDEHLNGHSGSRAEGFRITPYTGDQSESVKELPEVEQ